MADGVMRHPVSALAIALAVSAAAALFVVTLTSGGMLVWTSMTDDFGTLTGEWWSELFRFGFLLATPLGHSLLLGFGTALTASLIGVPLAWLAMRTDLPGARAVLPFVALPHIVPGFQLASAWLLLFTRGGVWNAVFPGAAPLPAYGGTAIWLVLSLHLYVFSFAVVAAGMTALDASLEEAGRAVGLSGWRVACKVTLPLLGAAILSGGLLCFAYAIEEFGVPSLLGTPTGFSTLTTSVYEQATTPPLAFGTASAQSLILGLVAVVVLGAGLWAGRRQTATLSGKGARRSRHALGRWRLPLAIVVWGFLLITALVPPVVLALTSCIRAWGMGYGPENWTLARHAALLASPEILRIALNTLLVAGLAAALAMLAGLAAAYGAVRRNALWARLADRVSFVAFATPGLVVALALLLTFGGRLNLYGTYAILVIAYMIRFSGIAVRSAATSLRQIGGDLECAGRAVGLRFPEVLTRISLPLARRGVLAGFLLAFINGVKEISSTSLLVSQGHETLAYEAYLRFQEGNYTQGSAISLWMIALALIVTALVARWGTAQGREAL